MYAADLFSVASSELGLPSVTVRVSGEIDMLTAPQLLDCLLTAAETHPRELVVDLTLVTFMDSSGIAALIKAHKRLPPTSNIVLRGVRRNVRTVLELTAVNALFKVEP
jgi:anti-sigma B factor antagonist